MTVLLHVLGVALLAAGLAGLVLPVLPGAVLLVGGVLVLAFVLVGYVALRYLLR